MAVEKADLLIIEGEKYVTLAVLNYEGNNYAFTNKIDDAEEPTEDFYIFREYHDEFEKVTDDVLGNILIPKFQEILKKELSDLINDN